MLHSYYTNIPVNCISLSQQSVLCLSKGNGVELWRDCLAQKAKGPYLRHSLSPAQSYQASLAKRGTTGVRNYLNKIATTTPTFSSSSSSSSSSSFSPPSRSIYAASLPSPMSPSVSSFPTALIGRALFCPYEDILGIAHAVGFSSIIVPGSGFAGYDSLEEGTDPFETRKRQREGEVKMLLDKLPATSITLHSEDLVGTVRAPVSETQEDIRAMERELVQRERGVVNPGEGKPKKKKVSHAEKRMRTLHRNVITQKKIDMKHKKQIEKEKKLREEKLQKNRKKNDEDGNEDGDGDGGDAREDDYDPFDRFKYADEKKQ